MQYNQETIRSKYKLVPRTLVFIRDKDRYLFIHKKKENSFGFKKLNGIGGHIEKGEEPFESALREIKEETGLIVNDLFLNAIVFIDIGMNPGILMFVFSATYTNGIIRESEEGNLEWVHNGEIKDRRDFVKDIPFLLEISEKHKKDSPPIFIKYLYENNKELRIVMN